MTQASTGLAKALARGGKVLSLADMTAEDILAGVNAETKAALLASAATLPVANGSMPDDEPGDDKCSKCSEPMKDGKCSKCSPDSKADAEASAFAAANTRALAVMGSEHFASNPDLARAMLANDKLSADEINGFMAIAAAGAPKPSQDDIEAAQRAAMQAELAKGRNSNIDAGNGGAGANAGQVDHSSGWKKAAAAANARYRL